MKNIVTKCVLHRVLNLSFMHKPTNAHFWNYDICLLFLAPTCFGSSCDQLQNVLQCKYKENNIILYVFYVISLVPWYLYCAASWIWSQDWSKHVDTKSKRQNICITEQLHKCAFVGLCMNDKFWHLCLFLVFLQSKVLIFSLSLSVSQEETWCHQCETTGIPWEIPSQVSP